MPDKRRGQNRRTWTGSWKLRGLWPIRAIEVDLVNVEVTFAKFALLRKHEFHGNCATTLVVVNIPPLGRTEGQLTTGRSICHLVLDEDIGLSGSRQMKAVYRKWSIDSINAQHVIVVSRKLADNTFSLFFPD